jgi:hypothetical protein
VLALELPLDWVALRSEEVFLLTVALRSEEEVFLFCGVAVLRLEEEVFLFWTVLLALGCET